MSADPIVRLRERFDAAIAAAIDDGVDQETLEAEMDTIKEELGEYGYEPTLEDE